MRGSPALDIDAFCAMAARLSAVAVAFSDSVREVDINPVRVLQEGCIGLDALVVSGARAREQAA